MSTNVTQAYPTLAPIIKSRGVAAVGALATGACMGLSLCKSLVFNPDIIRAQLSMSNFTMLKMFLSAAMVSTAVSFSLSLSPFMFVKITQVPNNWFKNIAGGALLGVAMFFTGSCPGTVLAQVGPGIKTAQLTLAGGVIGALVYSFLEPSISRRFPKQESTHSVDSLFGISQTAATGLLIGGFVAVLSLLEYIRPWQLDSGVDLSVSSLQSFGLFSPVWSPYVGGAIIGLLQIPSFLLMNQGLGTSSGYVSLLSHVLGGKVNKRQYFKNYYGTPASMWQLFLDFGIILGAGACFWVLGGKAETIGELLKTPNTKQTIVSILGGFFLIFGARLANGCTSGHGLTGIGRRSVQSIVAVMSMFGGGMLAAYLSVLMK